MQRIILVVDDLLVLEQLEEAVVRHVFEGLHPAAEIEHREGNAPEADGQEDDAAPVEIGLIAAGFILFLRVTIGFWHKGNGILTTEKGYHEQLAMQNGGGGSSLVYRMPRIASLVDFGKILAQTYK